MSNLTEYDLARQIWRYAGQKMEYIDWTGKRGSGILEGIQVHEETQETIALFRSFKGANILPCLFPPTKVPLRKVILPHTRRTRIQNSTRGSGESAQNQAGQRFKNFKYYNNLYVITYIRNFKTGDEVVWTKYSSGDVAYMGYIVTTAERQDTGNQITSCNSGYQEVAIIKFDVIPFTQTGEKAPGYIRYLPEIENTFLIPMTELLKLSEWIAITAKEEDNSHRDLWQRKEAVQDKIGEGKRLNKKLDQRLPSHHDTNDQSLPPPSPLTPQRLHSRRKLKEQRQLENVKLEGTLSTHHEEPQTSGNIEALNTRPEKDSYWIQQLKSICQQIQLSNELPKVSPIWENEWLLPINHAQFFSKIQKGGGFGIGVQGKNNSSYMDASLFALFSFNKTFDSCLHQLENEDTEKLTSSVKRVLRNDIILSIRREFHVSHEKVLGLRTLLGQEINSNCMDVEEFLTELFIKMNTPPLLNYDDGDADYFHRIKLPPTWVENRFVPYLSVQSLLEKSFETYNVKLTTMPHGGLIIKLPVSNGSLIPCTGVIPNLTLDLSSILKSTELLSTANKYMMNLHSVICQKDGQFVAFVRTGTEKNSPWIFMNSNPAMCTFAVVLPDIDKGIGRALGAVESVKSGSSSDMYFEPHYQKFYGPGYEKFSLFKNAYICLYV